MKSNGYGAFIQTIAVEVPLSQVRATAEALRAEPVAVDEDAGTARFNVKMTSTRRGDDETVLWTLAAMLPADGTFRIDWRRSDY